MSIEIIQHFINGSFHDSNEYLDSINPATLEVIARVPIGSKSLINDAVNAAKQAFYSWSKSSVSERSRLLNKVADLIERDIEKLALLESRDQGKTLNQAKLVEVPRAVHNFRFFANSILYTNDKHTEQDNAQVWNIRTRSPVGVAGIITPWNLPLYLLTFKLAPCIAYGNTCVIKPSEFTSMTAWKLCEIIKEAGIPDGVVNIVFGDGKITGDALIRHEDIKLITFTGSTATGNMIEHVVAGQNQFKKLSLEMGGKNAAVIFEDADIEIALKECIRSSFTNQGEVCLCTSRIFVHEDLYETFINRFVELTKNLKIGDPLESDTFMGPVVSKIHMNKILSYLNSTKGTIVCGFKQRHLELPKKFQQGYFIPPTVITNVTDNDPVMVDEIFGPVTVVVPFKSTEEVLKRVNASCYGLCASIYTRDQSRAIRVSKELQVGTVWVNCWLIRDLRMPFGGSKISGRGREGEDESRDFYTELKTVCFKY